jgi:long-chain acyl-CoA synthetase
MLPNIPAFPLTWLALGRIGAVMVPINPAYTPREIGHVVQVAGPEWIVTHADTRAALDQARAEGLVALDDRRLIVAGGAAGGALAWETLAATPADRFDRPSPSATTTC